MYDIHTRTGNFGKICTTLPHYPGYGYSIFILRSPKLVRMRVLVRIRVHVTGGVLGRGLTCVGRLSEQPQWRWLKKRGSGGQTRWTCELSGLCKVYHPKRWPAEGAVLFRPIMWLYSASVVLVWDSFLPFTLLWPYSSKVHLVLATALFYNVYLIALRSGSQPRCAEEGRGVNVCAR